MSAASATAALPNHPAPDPRRGPAASPTTRLLGLLQKLIDYGSELAHALQQPDAARLLFTVILRFGSRDFAQVLRRIARGLQLATALQARLASHRMRVVAAPTVYRSPTCRQRRTVPRAAPHPGLPEVPTAEEIAAALRHHSLVVVVSDICRDLGITPAHPLWREVTMFLAETGHSIMRFTNDVRDLMRATAANPDLVAGEWSAGWEVLWAEALADGTGPP